MRFSLFVVVVRTVDQKMASQQEVYQVDKEMLMNCIQKLPTSMNCERILKKILQNKKVINGRPRTSFQLNRHKTLTPLEVLSKIGVFHPDRFS